MVSRKFRHNELEKVATQSAGNLTRRICIVMNRFRFKKHQLRDQKYIILYRQESKQSKLYQAGRKIKVNKKRRLLPLLLPSEYITTGNLRYCSILNKPVKVLSPKLKNVANKLDKPAPTPQVTLK